jgi:uncharacterized protein YlxW (UPF0749 family)
MSEPRLTGPRHPLRSQALIGLTLAVLGFAFVVQLRTTHESTRFASARQEDLVRILDDLNGRGERLRLEIEDLERTRDRLTGGAGQDEAALQESRRRRDVLRILAGTVAASGPGIEVTITDPEHAVTADVLLDAMQELRDAGAEAVQINGVRVVADTWFADTDGGVEVSGTRVSPPYSVTALGDAATMASAMDIPGGVNESVRSDGGDTTVRQAKALSVTALHTVEEPRYARPVPTP